MRNIGLPGDYKRERSGWNISQGDYGEVEYEGTRFFVDSVFALLRNGQNVLELERVQEGAKWLLRARIQITPPANTEGGVIDDLRMTVNRVQKSIFEPPGVGSLTLDQLKKVRRAVDSGSDEDFFAMIELNSQEAEDLYALAVAGVQFRIVYQPVIYRTRSAPDGHNWPDHGNGVGTIFSHGQMIADANMGYLLNFNLPPTDAIVTHAGIDFIYGWLKHEPWYDTAAGNRTVEYLEYEYGLWPLLLYPGA